MTRRVRDVTTPIATWQVWVGPLVWAAHFLAIYALTALVCARKNTAGWFGVDTAPWLIGAATLVALVVLSFTMRGALCRARHDAALPEPSGFIHWLTAAVAALALLAVLWETLPVLLVPVCA